jgi:hypothetical protein
VLDSEVEVESRDSESILHAGLHKLEIFIECISRRGNSFLSSSILGLSRSQWPRGLRLELSSLAQMFRSWVQIPLKVRMAVLCSFILCLYCSVCR